MAQEQSSASSAASQGTSRGAWYFLAVALLVTGITYAGTLRFDFVYDDEGYIVDNPLVKSWHYAPRYFVSNLWAHKFPNATGGYYRPLFEVWTLANYSLFKLNPVGWHAMTVLLHLVVTLLVFLVIRKMTGRSRLAWLSALIFGMHPVHHEVVAWVTCACESLFAALFLGAFLAYLRSRQGARQGVWMSVSCVLYGLALLTKETAIVLPGLVFAHAWIAGGAEPEQGPPDHAGRFRRAFVLALLYVPVVAVYMVLRYKALSGLLAPQEHLSTAAWLLTLPSVAFFYVQHWFYPVHLSEFYDLPFQFRLGFRQVLLPASVVMGLALGFWFARGRLGRRETGWAAAWILFPLLPVLSFGVFRPDELVHDRYFYVPSLGAALLIALLVEQLARGKRAVFGQSLALVGAVLALTVVLAVGTVRAADFWASDYTLYTRAHQIAPMNEVAENNLSITWILQGNMDKAQALLEQVLREHPTSSLAATNLARVAYLKKDYPKAEAYSRLAIQWDASAADPYLTIGQVQLREHHTDDAVSSFRNAVVRNPYDAQVRVAYGIALETKGDCAGASAQFGTALALNPGNAFANQELLRCRVNAAPAPGASGASAKSADDSPHRDKASASRTVK